MIPFNAHRMVSLSRILDHGRQLQSHLDLHPWIAKVLVWRKKKTFSSFLEHDVKMLNEEKEYFLELGMTSTVDQIDRIAFNFERGHLSYATLIDMHKSLHERIQDDLKRGQFFMIPPHKVWYYLEASTVFGDKVPIAFPIAKQDIENAAKCYAFGRYTATVFHLMRVMEAGLRSLGASLQDQSFDPKRNPSWDAILRRCDKELKLPVQERSTEWKTNPQFYCDATANLRAVKDAWRNPTLHIEREYDEEEAFDVFNSVKGFMKHLATQLGIMPI